MRFDTEVTLSGPLRAPAQMLGSQVIRGAKSLHDSDVASSIGLTGAPIEAPTHFSQFDPLAHLVWGDAWYERGCISGHFRTMVTQGELVRASLTTRGTTSATIEAAKADGTPVLCGTASIGPNHPPSELDQRRVKKADAGSLYILDQLKVGVTKHAEDGVSITAHQLNGPLYPFSLADKLDTITEPNPWYTRAGGASSPWKRAIVPMEMISVLAHKSDPQWPIRTPSVGLFLDLEIRLFAGPIFVDECYDIKSVIVGVGQSRLTESYWSLTSIRNSNSEIPIAEVLLHAGVFKKSYPGYPKDELD